MTDFRESLELLHIREDHSGVAILAEAMGSSGIQPQAAQQGSLQRAWKGTCIAVLFF